MYRRENAGISSESGVRIPAVECLRFPGEGLSSQGKSGPKARPKGVVDGQLVDIPVPPKGRLNDVMTQKDSCSALMDRRGQIMRMVRSEVRVPLRLGD